MVQKIKRLIIFSLIGITFISVFININLGLYFGVVTNLLINAFWNSKLFPKKNNLEEVKYHVLNEKVRRPIID